MLLSKACVYGLRASLYLASRREGDYISIREMSDELEISFHFLTKILQQLTANALMESYKGPNGGIRLSGKGKEATLKDVVTAIDGPGLFTECALGLPGCGSEAPCPMHEQWVNVRENLNEMMENTNLVEMARKGRIDRLRITENGSFTWS